MWDMPREAIINPPATPVSPALASSFSQSPRRSSVSLIYFGRCAPPELFDGGLALRVGDYFSARGHTALFRPWKRAPSVAVIVYTGYAAPSRHPRIFFTPPQPTVAPL